MTRRLLALGLIVVGCGNPARRLARERLELVPQPDRPLGETLIGADQVVAGTLVRLRNADEYEPLGGLLGNLLNRGDRPPEAYQAEILVDSTLLGAAAHRVWITFFAPKGNSIPQKGLTAVWVLRWRVLWRLRRCSEMAALTATACPYDLGLALDSDDNVRPLEDWPRIGELLRRLGLRAEMGAR